MKKALLVVSFGTSYHETREKTIDICEDKIKNSLKSHDFFRAYTSNMIINKIKKRDGIEIDNPIQALDKIYEQGYDEVIIQTLHIICGEEFNKLKEQVDGYSSKFKKIVLGRPLLTHIEDYQEAVEAIKHQIPHMESNEAVVFMGHGTLHESHSAYPALEYMLRDNGINAYVGTVEGYPEIEHVIRRLKEGNIKTVNLMPFMLVAGDHAINDMAGDEADSWKTILEENGFNVRVHLKGLGENSYIQDKFVRHAVKCAENAKFYGIGAGPGDGSLLTIKAVNTLKKLDILYTPESKKGGDSLALSIVSEYLPESVEIKSRHFPMSFDGNEKSLAWDNVAQEIISDVNDGKNVGFVTLGDPMIYSTYVYIMKRILGEVEVETIPGISSFSNIASNQNFPLVMDKEALVVIPCTMEDDKIEYALQNYNSIVLMKVYKNFKEIIKKLEKYDLIEHAILVSNSSQESENVFTDLKEAHLEDKISYFSTILVNKDNKIK
ncbi:TPA: cobalt-factor II C(20)-methyltransferase [Clostridioides difficile]|nr:cobalt-factor II C(20)-methyltransferase [Clostridioides difficile]MDE3670387.1 cobalt-factor II C(20)-methyltransferase [Clostridioides difficile]HBH3166896.1 cobalt-factor II C(20)-methyltransferase [Clostridioides difficile]HBH3181023.1 cobalt-factor II C(20)-methyltransferase [Clostridioides difficile]HEK8984439.1 cobalt-factor II C(20)-methyltransferase [Clostridioides difficile]